MCCVDLNFLQTEQHEIALFAFCPSRGVGGRYLCSAYPTDRCDPCLPPGSRTGIAGGSTKRWAWCFSWLPWRWPLSRGGASTSGLPLCSRGRLAGREWSPTLALEEKMDSSLGTKSFWKTIKPQPQPEARRTTRVPTVTANWDVTSSNCSANLNLSNQDWFKSLENNFKQFMLYRHCRYFPMVHNHPEKCRGEIYLLMVIKSVGHPAWPQGRLSEKPGANSRWWMARG